MSHHSVLPAYASHLPRRGLLSRQTTPYAPHSTQDTPHPAIHCEARGVGRDLAREAGAVWRLVCPSTPLAALSLARGRWPSPSTCAPCSRMPSTPSPPAPPSAASRPPSTSPPPPPHASSATPTASARQARACTHARTHARTHGPYRDDMLSPAAAATPGFWAAAAAGTPPPRVGCPPTRPNPLAWPPFPRADAALLALQQRAGM